MTIILSQSELFAADRWPLKPYCTDDLDDGLRIRSYQHAIKRRYIQANPPHLRVWSLYDIDRPAGGLAWQDADLPPPAWASVNKDNGHAHLAYGLSAPVLTSSMEARQAPLRYLNAVEAAFRAKLEADCGYSGLITKNPQHPHWWTLRGPQVGYELGYLAEHVDLERFKPRQGIKVAEVGLGRNVTVFDFVRLWAYRNIRQYDNYVLWQKAVYDRCMARNGDFVTPMDSREIYHIARSVTKWVWSRFDLEASDARFSKLQSFRRTLGGGAPSLKTKLAEAICQAK
jgi:Replicase family/Primase C terminal 1 (PriCT-1)